jgi:triacylglycerol esterase/lipase EstA (alpha/beta hydrolase family)
LQGSGHAFVALSLEPVFGSIDDYTPQIEAAVQQVTLATGLPPLLVCHSMGGLAARAWLNSLRADERVHHLVTIGTPHNGTWLARFSRSLNGQQMRLASGWQAGLSHGAPNNRSALFTCWYSSSDNIVFPTSSASLPGADNRLLRGKAHVQMAFAPQVMDATLAMLKTTG